MRVKISNNIEISEPSNAVYQWCLENLVITNPMWEQLTRMGKEDTIRYKHIPQKLNIYVKKGEKIILPFGCLYGVWNLIKNSQMEWNFNSTNDTSNKFLPCPIELYDYQQEAVANMVAAKGGVLVSPAGSGKTITMIEIIHSIGRKFLWITHTGDLLRQAKKDFLSLYPNLNIGLITDGKVDIGKDGAIATVQTLDKIDKSLYEDEFDVVVVDECAHCAGSPTLSKMFSRVVGNIPARYKYGCTATPNRGDTMIKTMYTILGMSREGWFEPTFEIPRDRVKSLDATHMRFDIDLPMDYSILNADGTMDYNSLIDSLSTNDDRNNIIVDNVMKCLEEGRKQVILCSRVEHCKILYNMLKSNQTRVELVTGSVTAKKREEILNNPNNWDIIVATYSLLKEGVNVKELDTLHMTTPQKDKALVIQCFGRIERCMEGKKQPIAYDYVDTKIPYCLGAFKKRQSIIRGRK